MLHVYRYLVWLTDNQNKTILATKQINELIYMSMILLSN